MGMGLCPTRPSRAREPRYEKALIIRKEIYGEKHGDVATRYNNLGSVYRNLGLYSEANVYYEKAVIIRKEIYGDHHALTKQTFRTLKIVQLKFAALLCKENTKK